ncbi:MAG: hypothetical protein HYX75_22825 [Acidobacteria bacterium]|nr:hypothetical protein [Acidobacteriota bacterium]
MRPRALGRSGSYVVLAMTLWLAGCEDSPTTPDPLPTGLPNAKIFDNLQLARQLEAKQRTDTIFTEMSGDFDLDGTCSEGGGITYEFTRVQTLERFDWAVYCDGQIELYGPLSPVGSITIIDVGSMMKINSDEAIRLARKYGGEAFVKLYPDAIAVLRYSIMNDYPVCKVQFFKIGVRCEPEYWLHAGTGELLQKAEDCISAEMDQRP